MGLTGNEQSREANARKICSLEKPLGAYLVLFNRQIHEMLCFQGAMEISVHKLFHCRQFPPAKQA